MISHVQVYLQHLHPHLPQLPVPVITTGICLFLVLAYIFSHINTELLQSWALSPTLLFQFELPRLNTYPLVHSSFLHLFFNLIVLYYPLAEFELSHGSLHTALVVNTLGAVTGIAYSITTFILVQLHLTNSDSMDTLILGSSGFVFTFLTVSCLKKSQSTPESQLFTYKFPTVLIPLIYLVVSALLVPNSSFLGHLISIIIGFIIHYGIFALITIPPFQILQKIESLPIFKNVVEIVFPSEYFIWIWEHDVVDVRYKNISNYLPLFDEN